MIAESENGVGGRPQELFADLGDVERLFLTTGLWASTNQTLPGCDGRALLRSASMDVPRLVARGIWEKMLPMVAECARSHAWECHDDVYAVTEVFRVLSAHLLDAITPVMDALQAEGLPFMAIKGLDLRSSCYPSTLPRVMEDVDLLVQWPHVSVITQKFRERGWLQGNPNIAQLRVDELPQEDVLRQATAHYELCPFRRISHVPVLDRHAEVIRRYLTASAHVAVVGERVYFCEECDVHFNISPDFDVRDVWFEPRNIMFTGGRAVLAQNASNLLWFHAARMYHEVLITGTASIRQFFDILSILVGLGDRIDWQLIKAMADKYHLHPALYYTFWHAREFLPHFDWDEILSDMHPAKPNRSRLHDWGDFMPKLFGCVRVTPLVGAANRAAHAG